MRSFITAILSLLIYLSVYSQDLLKVQAGATITLAPGAIIKVQGNASFDNGALLSNSGNFILENNNLNVTINLADNSTTPYNYGQGIFTVVGSGSIGLYSPNIFDRIEVSTAGLQLNSDINARQWSLAAGVISTGSNKAIILGTAASDFSAATSNSGFWQSWINGTLRRFINPQAENAYQFAIGNGAKRNLVVIDNLLAGGLTGIQYIDVSFGSKIGSDQGLLVAENGVPYNLINPAGVFHINADNTPLSGHYDLKLSLDGFSGLTDNNFAILQRDDGSQSAADWHIPSGSLINPPDGGGRLVSDNFSLRKNIGSFGQFGIGQLSSTLPVTLADFTARRVTAAKVRLEWKTSTESNNKGFGIERMMVSESSFTSIAFVPTISQDGNSTNTLTYTFDDNNVCACNTFYRLKQTDNDSKTVISATKMVAGLPGNTTNLQLWPNPSMGQFSVQLQGISRNVVAHITDLQGRLLKTIVLQGSEPTHVTGLRTGIFILTIPAVYWQTDGFKTKFSIIQ